MIDEVDGLLVNVEFLEQEGHDGLGRRKKMSSRAYDQETAVE